MFFLLTFCIFVSTSLRIDKPVSNCIDYGLIGITLYHILSVSNKYAMHDVVRIKRILDKNVILLDEIYANLKTVRILLFILYIG